MPHRFSLLRVIARRLNQRLLQRSGFSFALVAAAVLLPGVQAVYRTNGGDHILPLWGTGFVALFSGLAYLNLVHRYLGRKSALHQSRDEVEWRGFALAKAPFATLAERPDKQRGWKLEPSLQLEQWLNGLKLPNLEALAPLLAERDREPFLATLRALRDTPAASGITAPPVLDVTLNPPPASNGTALPVRPLRLEGQRLAGGGVVIWARDMTQPRARELAWQTDRAVYEQEIAKLCTITETLPRPLWLRRVTGQQLIWCNEAYAKAMGVSRETAVSEQVEFAPSSQNVAARDLARRAVETDRIQAEERHVVVDGERKLFRIIETPVMLEGYIVGIAFDQTELEETRSEVRLHQRSFEETLEQLATPMAIFGADQRMQFSNHAYQRLWQLEETFVKSHPSYGDMLEDLRSRRKLPDVIDFQRWKREKQAMFTALIEPDEEMMYLPDGTSIRSVRIPHPLGGLMFVTEDVTDKLRLESSYNTLIAVQRETLDNLAEGIAVLGSDGRLKLHNPAFAQIWRLDSAALDRSPHIGEMLELMRPLLAQDGAEAERTGENKGENWAGMRQRLAGEMLQREPLTARIQRANNSIVEHVSVPLPDGNVLHSYLDVSDSVRVEQALRETNKALAAADKMKSEFVATVSHQLRTPLSTIIGFAEILTNQYFGQLSDRQMDYAKTILDASSKLLTLINAVLDLATIEAGRMLLNRKPVALQKLLLAAVETAEGAAARQQVTITVDPPAEGATIEVDERRIGQVLSNLLLNAVQYTAPGGRIQVGAKPAEVGTPSAGQMGLYVQDNGIGMSADEQQRVFQKFERANPQARQPGVGLGLSLVKSLVELHGGSIALDSRINEGTTVTCYVPIRAQRYLDVD